jgi:adenosylcobinamide kinase / adenosylcobinamide-phosphate guanylyltransferase
MTATKGSGRLTLVLGGARSGKSRHAETLVRAAGPPPWTYVATAEALDTEMEERIAAHRAARGAQWATIDAPHELASTLRRLWQDPTLPSAVLVDCLTLWVSNRLLAGAELDAESTDLVEALAGAAVPLVVVSNEVGFGIVPDNALSRRFRDAAGRLHQMVAERADEVVLVAAGLPLRLKP